MPIVTLTGASGSGKTTYARELLKRPEWKLVNSTTTRAPRTKDLPGEYSHLDAVSFYDVDAGKEFLWTSEHHGHRYGTMLRDVADAAYASSWRGMMLIDGGVIPLLRDLFPEPDVRVAHVYLFSPAEAVLRERLERRKERDGLTDEEIERRVTECRTWDEEALASDLPYLFVPGEILIADAAAFICRLTDRQFRKGVTP